MNRVLLIGFLSVLLVSTFISIPVNAKGAEVKFRGVLTREPYSIPDYIIFEVRVDEILFDPSGFLYIGNIVRVSEMVPKAEEVHAGDRVEVYGLVWLTETYEIDISGPSYYLKKYTPPLLITNKADPSDYPPQAIAAKRYTCVVKWKTHNSPSSQISLSLVDLDMNSVLAEVIESVITPGDDHKITTLSTLAPKDRSVWRLEIVARLSSGQVLDSYEWTVTVVEAKEFQNTWKRDYGFMTLEVGTDREVYAVGQAVQIFGEAKAVTEVVSGVFSIRVFDEKGSVRHKYQPDPNGVTLSIGDGLKYETTWGMGSGKYWVQFDLSEDGWNVKRTSDGKPIAVSVEIRSGVLGTETTTATTTATTATSTNATTVQKRVILEGPPRYEDMLPNELDKLLEWGGIKDTAVFGDFHAILSPSELVRAAQLEVVAEYIRVGDRQVGQEVKRYPLTLVKNDYVATVRLETWWPFAVFEWVTAVLAAKFLGDPGYLIENIGEDVYLPEYRTYIGFERIYVGAKATKIVGTDIVGNDFEILLEPPIGLKTSYEKLSDWARTNDYLWVQSLSPVALSVVDESGNRVGAYQNKIHRQVKNGYYLGEPGKPQLVIIKSPVGRYTAEIEGLDQGTYTLYMGAKVGGNINQKILAEGSVVRRGDRKLYQLTTTQGPDVLLITAVVGAVVLIMMVLAYRQLTRGQRWVKSPFKTINFHGGH